MVIILYRFHFQYKNIYEFYYIQYLKQDFSTFETWRNPYENDKPYYLVPIEMLKPIDKLINILLNYKLSTF